MTIDSLLAELETEQEWRERELRFLHNTLEGVTSGHKDLFRRPVVVMLYSHFEGFCKFAFLAYVRAINEASLVCGEASYALAAAALSDLFAALRDPSGKCHEFRNQLPDDSKLHLFAREREFIERSDNFAARPVVLPDSVVDLNSNLNPSVLRKALYKLGLSHDQFGELEGRISLLLEYRNKIAHGSFQNGVTQEQYLLVREAVESIMNAVKNEVVTAVREERYRRASGLSQSIRSSAQP